LALFAALLVPVTYIHPYLFSKWKREVMSRGILRAQGIFKVLQEVFSHIHLVKALGREKYEMKRFELNLQKRVETELKNAKVSQVGSFSSSVLQKIISGIIALYGGYQVIRGTMTLGSLTAIMIYLTQFIGYLKSVGELYQITVVNSVVRSRLAEILDIRPHIYDAEDAGPYHIKKGTVEFREVYFGYKENNLVLRNMSFLVEPQAKIALVGLSGSGKTTILYLILRLYQQQKGAVFIDGVDTRKIKLESLKSQVSIALQDSLLWNDTIMNNISYGAESATGDDVIRAAQLAHAHDFIMKLSNQYDSVIGERACKISEGQKQRIAVARTLIRKPKVLILDEAMSSLDSETEDKIVDNIKKEFKDSTAIIVSHRLSTVKKMDFVYFLENPGKMDIGTHSSLLLQNKNYRELFASQIEEGVSVDGYPA
ncbi:MAG: ABC transporter ATP-binding protein, partial [Candidatus Omnitrophota bacterium]